jgi:hypothetical protein
MVGRALLESARSEDVIALAKCVRYLMTQTEIVQTRARTLGEADIVEYIADVQKEAVAMLHSDPKLSDLAGRKAPDAR